MPYLCIWLQLYHLKITWNKIIYGCKFLYLMQQPQLRLRVGQGWGMWGNFLPHRHAMKTICKPCPLPPPLAIWGTLKCIIKLICLSKMILKASLWNLQSLIFRQLCAIYLECISAELSIHFRGVLGREEATCAYGDNAMQVFLCQLGKTDTIIDTKKFCNLSNSRVCYCLLVTPHI